MILTILKPVWDDTRIFLSQYDSIPEIERKRPVGIIFVLKSTNRNMPDTEIFHLIIITYLVFSIKLKWFLKKKNLNSYNFIIYAFKRF